MKISTFFTLVWLCAAFQCFGQEKQWTAADKQSAIDNLVRTRDAVVKETENLTPEQWAFRESPDRWSIAQIVEHLALWEIVWFRELSIGTRNKPQPELIKTSRPDSYYHEFIMEPNPHKAAEIAAPTGFIKGKDNLSFFLRGREQSLTFVRTSEADMRAIFRTHRHLRPAQHAPGAHLPVGTHGQAFAADIEGEERSVVSKVMAND